MRKTLSGIGLGAVLALAGSLQLGHLLSMPAQRLVGFLAEHLPTRRPL